MHFNKTAGSEIKKKPRESQLWGYVFSQCEISKREDENGQEWTRTKVDSSFMVLSWNPKVPAVLNIYDKRFHGYFGPSAFAQYHFDIAQRQNVAHWEVERKARQRVPRS